jgi:long-chain fatty acid transport protein
MLNISKMISKSTGALVLLAVTQQAWAGAFQLHEQSTTYLGNAFAGTTSPMIPDASSTYYNPASLSDMCHNQVLLSGIYYYGSIKLYDATATNNVGTNVVSSPTSRPASNAIIPGVSLAARINRDIVFGFSINAPFGLNTRYDDNSIARYMGTISKVETININPSLSYKINNQFALGAGFDAMRVKATINSAIHYATEGYVNNTGHGWTYGYHLGVQYTPVKDTKMGLVYFSIYNAHVTGTVATLGYPIAPVPTSLTSDIKLPDRLVYSVTHRYNSSWEGMGEIEYVHWSRLSELRIVYNTGRYSLENLNYKNTFRFALGANYHLSDAWLFKGGLAFDQTPVRSEYRTARLPDSDRFWVALGTKYKVNRNLSLDAAYSHLFFKSSSISQRGVVTGDTAKSLYGNYRSSADLVGVQLTWNFV